ncbi:Broad specificity phosphatase PhoE [Cognatiyoonia sediminum]|uniref:Broad specificity phosphatase PhoE n=1 Tax=Cognatiyoonia sediminum TaxID=1508389 RepID=A0A1M5NHY3_9RHOB|nr:histidine phosphatase family protein [Cognatiyoonia sediminum]SHG89065.1 Broad specificity phosphatase PhoE [Cognatiyoonia sediminum]
MTHFWWVRHGPTHQKNFVGWRDVPADLSDADLIGRVSDYLPQDAVVISSDLSRAITTADVIQDRRERLPHDPRLREFNFGAWDGLKFDEVAKRDPELSRAFWEKPGDLSAPDGESWNDVSSRVNTAVDHLIQTQSATHIVAVAHIGVIMTQIQKVVGDDPYKAMSFEIDNFSVTDLRYSDGQWFRGEINHLP